MELFRLLLYRMREEDDGDPTIRGFVKSVERATVLPWEKASPSAASVQSRRGFGYRIWFSDDT